MEFIQEIGRPMNSGKKLTEIAGKLDVTEDDVSKIKKQYRLVKILSPIIGCAVVALSALYGYLEGKDDEPKLINRETGKVYPYAIPALFVLGTMLPATKRTLRRRKNVVIIAAIVITTILSIIAFMLAQDAAQPIEYYSGSIEYGVYSKESDLSL